MIANSLLDKKVLITAGPTREALDPVRFLSNHSSGKMGYAIAEAFLQRGAKVILVSGPVNLTLSHPDLEIIQINSAREMLAACKLHFRDSDILIFSAAVADYRPAFEQDQKIKKSEEEFDLRLVKNPDIALEFGKIKSAAQISVGFALETQNEHEHALEKLKKKNLDLIILNSTRDEKSTFGYDTNKVKLIFQNEKDIPFPLKSKKELAGDIAEAVARLIKQKN